MKALILAGGYGKRLWPLTWFTPKPMIKINGKPILEHIVNYLKRQGIDEIYIKTHYLPKKIMDHFGSRLIYYYERDLKEEEQTLITMFPYLKSDWTVVLNGDTLTNLDIMKMFRLSSGKNVKYMDGETYAGVRIITPFYLGEKTFTRYQDKEAWWCDTGTWEGLKKAKKLYEKITNLPTMRN